MAEMNLREVVLRCVRSYHRGGQLYKTKTSILVSCPFNNV